MTCPATAFAVGAPLAAADDFLLLFVVVVVLASAVVFYFLIRKEARRIERAERRQCANCGYDLRATTDCCPECGLPVKASRLPPAPFDPVALLNDWPDQPIEPRVPAPGEPPVVVHSTRHSTEADLVSQHLQARGVWCRLTRSESTGLSGRTVVPVVSWLVAVASADELAARQILDRLRKPISAAGRGGVAEDGRGRECRE